MSTACYTVSLLATVWAPDEIEAEREIDRLLAQGLSGGDDPNPPTLQGWTVVSIEEDDES